MSDLKCVNTNRVEVIDHYHRDDRLGRAYVFWEPENTVKVELVFQDDGRTLKVFLSRDEP